MGLGHDTYTYYLYLGKTTGLSALEYTAGTIQHQIGKFFEARGVALNDLVTIQVFNSYAYSLSVND